MKASFSSVTESERSHSYVSSKRQKYDICTLYDHVIWLGMNLHPSSLKGVKVFGAEMECSIHNYVFTSVQSLETKGYCVRTGLFKPCRCPLRLPEVTLSLSLSPESKLTLTTTQKNNGFIYQNEVTYSQESVDMCAGLLVLISGESGIKKKKIIKNENVFRNDSKSAFRQNMRRL